MVYVSEDVSAAEVAARDRGAPLFVATNILEQYTTVPQWRLSGSWATGTNISAPSAPTFRCFDRRAKLPTQATAASGQSAVSLLFDLTASVDRSFDCAFIFGTNIESLGGEVDVTLTISDVNTFSGADPSTVDLATWSPTTNGRLGSIALETADGKRYSSVRYLRLKFVQNVGTFATNPRVGEVWLGRRRQLPHPPSIPYDEAPRMSDVIDSSNKAIMVRHTKSYGGSVRAPKFILSSADSPDGAQALRDWWSDSSYGVAPSVYVEDPSDLSTASMVSAGDTLSIPLITGVSVRETQLILTEIAPFVSSEVSP